MKRSLLLISLIILAVNVFSQITSFSDSAEYSLLTCSPGEELYAKFGHTGIRVVDPENKLDIVFNYGLFSFNTENFYYKFVKGETDYQLGVSDTKIFLEEYKLRNSFVWEQKILLTKNEKKLLSSALIENYRPENRVYRYNFIYDNCATKPRDKILESCQGIVKIVHPGELRTFRSWIGFYTGSDSWTQFGIDLVFGSPADDYANTTESMFLPEVLMSEFQNIRIIRSDSVQTEQNLVGEPVELVEGQYKDSEIIELEKPIYFFGILMLFGILLTIWETKTNHYLRSFDSLLLFISGLAGIIIFYLMFFSVHPMIKSNMNILWLNPLNIFAAIIIWIKPLRFGILIYKIFNIILLIIVLILFAISYQSFNTASFPVIILFLVRYGSYILNSEKAQVSILKKSENN